MAEPTKKDPQVELALSKILGGSRAQAIRNDICVPKPIGCGGPAIEFKNDLSKKEYTISGLCQKCQDSIYGND